MSADIKQIKAVLERAKLLHSKQEVDQAISRMAIEMAELEEKNPLLLCVMQGGVVLMGQLLTQLNFPLQIDYIHASRYRGKTSGGEVNWLVKTATPLKNRTVVIVDDILDEGMTLTALVDFCLKEGAAEVKTAILLDKKTKRGEGGVESADYTGISVENHYVFGYGMDYKEYLRNAPGIYAVHPDDI